jgi:hypothetical protein
MNQLFQGAIAASLENKDKWHGQSETAVKTPI